MKAWIIKRRRSGSRKSSREVPTKSFRIYEDPPQYAREDRPKQDSSLPLGDPTVIGHVAFKEIFSTQRKCPTRPRQADVKGKRDSTILWPTECPATSAKGDKEVYCGGFSERGQIPSISITLVDELGADDQSIPSIDSREEGLRSCEPWRSTAVMDWPLRTGKQVGNDGSIGPNFEQVEKEIEFTQPPATGLEAQYGTGPSVNSMRLSAFDMFQGATNDTHCTSKGILARDNEPNLNAQDVAAKRDDTARVETEDGLNPTRAQESSVQEDAMKSAEIFTSPLTENACQRSVSHEIQVPRARMNLTESLASQKSGHSSLRAKTSPQTTTAVRDRRHTYTPGSKSSTDTRSDTLKSHLSRRSSCASPSVRDIAKTMYELSQSMQSLINSDVLLTRYGSRAASLTPEEVQSQMRQISASCVQMQYLASQQMSAVSADLLQFHLMAPCLEHHTKVSASSLRVSPDLQQPVSTVSIESRGLTGPDSLLRRDTVSKANSVTNRRSVPDTTLSLSEVPPLAPLSVRYVPQRYRRSRSSSVTEATPHTPMQNF